MKKKNIKWPVAESITLRDYQIKCLNAIEKGLKKHDAVLIQVPTGGGKTLIFNTYALNNSGNTLILVHRKELLRQTEEKYTMIGGLEENIGEISRGKLNIAQLTIGMIQTVYKKIDKMDFKDFETVIIDEAHHSMAGTWKKTIEYFKNGGCKVLGVTATPFRTDEQELNEIYDELVFKLDVTDLIKETYLTPVIGKMVYVDADYSRLKSAKDKSTGESDYTLTSIEKTLNTDEINKQVVQKWIEEGENRKTIFFTVSIEHANALKDEFLKNNISSSSVSSKLSYRERDGIIQDFKDGKIKIIVNVDILTEGFDDPSVQCIGLLRPTKSLSLYAQIVGRGLRPAHDKKDCLVLDFTGRNRSMSIVGLGELFDLPPELKEHIDEEGISVGAVELDEYEENIDGDDDFEPKKKRELRVLIGKDTESFSFDGKEAMEYATKISDGHYILSCGRNGKVLTLKKEKKKNAIYLNDKKLKSNLPDSYSWLVFTTLWKHYKDDFAEDFIKKAKDEHITKKQTAVLTRAKNKGLISEIPADMSSASNLISHLVNNQNAAGVIFNSRNGINYIRDEFFSPFRYEFQGIKLTIAHAFLLSFGMRIPAPKWVETLKSGLNGCYVSQFPKINTDGLKNKIDKGEIERLKAGRVLSLTAGIGYYIDFDNDKITKFFNFFKNKLNNEGVL